MYTQEVEYITTTGLRTKSSQLIQSLKKGAKVSLIHRSKVVGIIEPIKKSSPKTFNVEEFKKILKDLAPLKPTTPVEREKNYREHLMKKYGKGLS